MRLYVDTNVFIDFLSNRRESPIFSVILKCGWTIVISTHALNELKHQGYFTPMFSFMQLFRTELVCEENIDLIASRGLKTHFSDALHIVLANRYNCDYIITNNIKDFYESKVPVRRPNDKL